MNARRWRGNDLHVKPYVRGASDLSEILIIVTSSL